MQLLAFWLELIVDDFEHILHRLGSCLVIRRKETKLKTTVSFELDTAQVD